MKEGRNTSNLEYTSKLDVKNKKNSYGKYVVPPNKFNPDSKKTEVERPIHPVENANVPDNDYSPPVLPKIYSPKTDTDLKPKVSKTLSSTERTLNLRPNYSSNSTVSKNTSFEKNQSQSTTLPIFEFRPNYSNTPPQKSTNFKTNKNYSNVGNNIPKSSFHKSEPLPPPISDHLSVNNRGGTSEPSLFNSNKKPSSNQFSSSAPMHANERDIKCYGTVSVIKSGGFGFIKEDSLQQDIFF